MGELLPVGLRKVSSSLRRQRILALLSMIPLPVNAYSISPIA